MALGVGLLFQSAVISHISSVLVEMSMLRQRHREEMRVVHTYMTKKQLPPELRDKISYYYERSYKDNKGVDEASILTKVNTTLRNEIMQFNAKELLTLVPLFKNNPPEIFTAFAGELQSETFVQDTYVLNEGEPVSVSGGVYFVRSGAADIMAQHGNSNNDPATADAKNMAGAPVITTIGDGCYFGDVAVVFGKKRTTSVRAATMMITYSLDTDAWERLFGTFDYLREYVTLVAKRRDERAKVLSRIAVEVHKMNDDTPLKEGRRLYEDEEDGLTEFVSARRKAESAVAVHLWKGLQRKSNALNSIKLSAIAATDASPAQGAAGNVAGAFLEKLAKS